MSRFWDGIVENPLNIINPASYAPVDPEAGSQGASRDNPLAQVPGLGGLQSISDIANGISQEGIGGLFDYQGMMDRQAAQRELASRFNVVPDGTPGERSQNQVSEEQFREIARNYSDIRLDRTDIHMDTSALSTPAAQAQYRTDLMSNFADQMQTESGRELIDTLAHNTRTDAGGTERHHTTTFAPRLNAAGNPDNSNAGEQPLNPDGTNASLTDARHQRPRHGAGRRRPGVGSGAHRSATGRRRLRCGQQRRACGASGGRSRSLRERAAQRERVSRRASRDRVGRWHRYSRRRSLDVAPRSVRR